MCFQWRKQPLTVSIDARSVRSTCVHAAIVNNEVSRVSAFHPGHRHRLITSGHNTLHVGAAPNWFFRLHVQPFTTAFHICDISLIFFAERHDWSKFAPSWWCSLLWLSCFVTENHLCQSLSYRSRSWTFLSELSIQRNVPIHLVLCFELFQTYKINHFLLAVRNFFTRRDVCPFLQQRILPNRVLERRLDSNHQLMGTHEHVWVLFRSIKTSMVSNPAKYVVVLPRLDQCAHLSSKHKTSVSYDHLEVVHTLCVQVLILLNCLPKVVSRSIVSFQVLLRRLLLVTLEQQFCNLLRCHGIRFPEAVRPFRCANFVRSAVASLRPSRRWSSWFRLHRSNQSQTAAEKHNWLHAKSVWKMIVFCLGRTLKMNGLPAPLGLEISCREKFSTMKYWMWSFFKYLCRLSAMRSQAPFGLFDHAIPYSSCLGPQKHQCLSLHCFVSPVTCCVCNICCLIVFLSTIYVVKHRQECDSAFESTRYRGFKQRLNVSHDLDCCVLGDIFRNLSFSILCNEFDRTKVPQAVSPHSILRDHPFSSLLIHRFFFILTKSTNWLWFCRNLHMGAFLLVASTCSGRHKMQRPQRGCKVWVNQQSVSIESNTLAKTNPWSTHQHSVGLCSHILMWVAFQKLMR